MKMRSCLDLVIFFVCASLISFSLTNTTAQIIIPVDKFIPGNYLFHLCLGENYTEDSSYGSNLAYLLSSLSFNSGSINNNGFYSSTFGERPDTVYGSFQCRGDVTSEGCSACVNTATQDIRTKDRCQISKEAIIWYDECMLRYSNQTFFSLLQDLPSVALVNSANTSDPERLNENLVVLMRDLRTQAVKPSSNNTLFASGMRNITNFESVYGFVQCSSDLNPSVCDMCLQRVIGLISVCCNGRPGGRRVTPSCSFRYETYPFLLTRANASPPPAPANNNNTRISSPPANNNNTRISSPPANNNNTRISLPPANNKAKIYMVVIPVVAAVLLFAFAFSIYLLRRKASRENDYRGIMQASVVRLEGAGSSSPRFYRHDEAERNEVDVPFVDFKTIITATGNFSNSNKLGQGGFGPVYKGIFKGGQELAVKRLSRSSGQGLEEFRNEVLLIAKLQHRNLVKLLGYCMTEEEKVLLYEYMPNKSLDSFIFDRTLCLIINWEKRLDIILGIARGILYLHQDSRLRIIHRDLKTSNILLDKEMNPKISDFGLARICGEAQTEGSTNRVVGTYGYMAPEYALDGLFSVKSDVYSFGVVLLEIISGKKNSGFHVSDDSLSFIRYAWKLWNENKVLDFIDKSLCETCNAGEVLKCIQVGLLCVQEDANDRPTMSSAVYMLGSEATSLPTPKQPAFVFRRYQSSTTTSSSRPESCSKNEITVSEEEGR